MNDELALRLRERISRAVPDIPLDAVRVVTEGFDSDALIVDDAWVFRFPRRQDVAAQLAVEQALLPALAAHVPIAIPRFEIQVPATDDSFPFVGYRLLPGTQLRAAYLAGLAAPRRAAIAAQLGAFLSALHSFPVEQARSLAPSIEVTEREPIEQEAAAVEDELFPLLTPAEQRWAQSLYSAASDPAIWRWTPVVTHNDLSADHILVDQQTQRLSGIIDWGDMALGDPANDFAALVDYDQPFVDAVLQHYSLPVDAAFRTRIMSLLPRTLFRNLRWLVQHEHDDGIALNLRELRERTAARSLER